MEKFYQVLSFSGTKRKGAPWDCSFPAALPERSNTGRTFNYWFSLVAKLTVLGFFCGVIFGGIAESCGFFWINTSSLEIDNWRLWMMSQIYSSASLSDFFGIFQAFWFNLWAGTNSSSPEVLKQNALDIQALLWPLRVCLPGALGHNFSIFVVLLLNVFSFYITSTILWERSWKAWTAALLFGLNPYFLREISQGNLNNAVAFTYPLGILLFILAFRLLFNTEKKPTAETVKKFVLYFGLWAAVFIFLFLTSNSAGWGLLLTVSLSIFWHIFDLNLNFYLKNAKDNQDALKTKPLTYIVVAVFFIVAVLAAFKGNKTWGLSFGDCLALLPYGQLLAIAVILGFRPKSKPVFWLCIAPIVFFLKMNTALVFALSVAFLLLLMHLNGKVREWSSYVTCLALFAFLTNIVLLNLAPLKAVKIEYAPFYYLLANSAEKDTTKENGLSKISLSEGVIELPLGFAEKVSNPQMIHKQKVLNIFNPRYCKFLQQFPNNSNLRLLSDSDNFSNNGFINALRDLEQGVDKQTGSKSLLGLKQLKNAGYTWVILHQRGCNLKDPKYGELLYSNYFDFLRQNLGEPFICTDEFISEGLPGSFSQESGKLNWQQMSVFTLRDVK